LGIETRKMIQMSFEGVEIEISVRNMMGLKHERSHVAGKSM
jgi:hypothetical protein